MYIVHFGFIKKFVVVYVVVIRSKLLNFDQIPSLNNLQMYLVKLKFYIKLNLLTRLVTIHVTYLILCKVFFIVIIIYS